MLYIEFDILSDQKFDTFLEIYPIIVEANHSESPKSIDFWLILIPPFAKAYFNLVAHNHPDFDSYKLDFRMMMDYLQINLEVDYKECISTTVGKGRLEFVPLSYPYGGMDRLLLFLSAFDCKATTIDSGFGIKKVIWHSDLEFSCKTL